MNIYLEARQWLRTGVSFQEFSERLPTSLLDSGLLSLLLGATIEQGLEPFDRYMDLLIKTDKEQTLITASIKMSLLMLACKKSKDHVVRALLAHPSIQVYHRDQNGRNTVHYAIENADETYAESIMRLLFDKYPQLEMGNYPKGNYLTLAIREAKPHLVRRLVEEEIDPNFRSLEGLGPLHQAVRAHKAHKNKEITLEILKTLIEAGYREEIHNNEGQDYIHYAREKGFLHDSDIDQILAEVMTIKTPKATIETSPEEKIQQAFSIESNEGQQGNLIDSQSQSEEDLKQEEQPNHYQISAEMYSWAKSVQDEHARVWKLLFPFYAHIQKIVHEYYGSIEVIGSFASQLWIPTSDIDLLLVIPDGGSSICFEEITQSLYKRISCQCTFSSIKLIRTYKLPLIKLILSEQFERLEIELFLSSKNNIASKYVAYTNEIMAYFPEIAVIYYVLRRLLSIRKLHDHRTGGLKAYALFLLIYSMRTLYQYPYVSQFVEHFCYYYGFAFEYQAEVNQEGEVQYHINIVDPLNSENNMGGKRTDILALQETLKKIYYALNTESKGSKMDYICDVLRYL